MDRAQYMREYRLKNLGHLRAYERARAKRRWLDPEYRAKANAWQRLRRARKKGEIDVRGEAEKTEIG